MDKLEEEMARALHGEMLRMETEDGGEGCSFEELSDAQRACIDRLAQACAVIARKRVSELEAKVAQFVAIMGLTDSEGFTPEVEQALIDLCAALLTMLKGNGDG